MHEGTVKTVVVDRGFGFIAEANGPDIFFHVSDVVGMEFDESLIERRVMFDVTTSPKGPRATNVRPAN